MRGRRESSLVGPRVMLRALDARDYSAWRDIRVRSRDFLEPWEPLPEPGSPDPVADADAFRARCGAWERQRQFDTAYGYGLFLHDGTLLGEVSLGSVLRGPFQSSFIGYWIDEKQAGNGYVPEGVALVIRYGFDTLGLHRLEAAIVPRNDRSRRVAEKLGLRDEGTARRFLQIRGVWEDHVRYAITVEDWKARRAGLEQTFLS
ncbi:MAG TPA: GNAT family protein [Acidimicrobiia bacterium]|nr:GNAT family protein [Acidimicrobiia bacterium]